MKKLFALLAVVLAVVSCQKDVDNLDVNVGGEQLVNITVGLPEATRAASDTGFNLDALVGSNYELRYILEIYVDGNTTNCIRQEVFTTDQSVVFPVRLVPQRNYRVVAWADIVPVSATERTAGVNYDYYYETSNGLDAVTIIENDEIKWNAMDEYRDAYTAYQVVNNFTANTPINLTLKRPFAKLRVVSTDIKNIEDLGYILKNGVVEYNVDLKREFNALYGTANTARAKAHTFTYPTPYDDKDNKNSRTLFADYIFVNNIEEQDAVQFTLKVYEQGGLLKSTTFNTDIALRANALTTIIGEVLTVGGNVQIEIDGELNEDQAKDYTVVSSASHLLNAINAGGEHMLGNDIIVTEADAAEADGIITRSANEPKTTTINLNGKTITIINKSNEPLVTVPAGNTLTFTDNTNTGSIVLAEGSTESFIENEGNVVLEAGTITNQNNDKPVIDGKIVVDGATVNDNEVDESDRLENKAAWLTDVLTNGGTYVFTEDMKAGQIKVTATAPVVLDGNGYTFTYTGSDRAIEIPKEATGANVTIKNLNIALKAGYCERGINFNVTNGILTINNVKVSETGTAATYAINLPGYSDNATVVINNSYLRGNIALNVWGENVTINATGSEFVSYDGTEVENYSAISLNNDGTNIADGTNVIIEGGKIIALDENGEESNAIRNSTNTGTVTVSESTEVIGILSAPVAIVTYAGYDQFYSCTTLQRAINKAAENSNATVKLIKDITLDEPVMVEENQTIVLDLGGKTISNPNGYAIENSGALTINGEGNVDGLGNIRSHAGKVTINSGTFTGSSDWNNGTYQHILKAVNTEVVINGGTFDATIQGMTNAMINVSENSTITINGGTFKNVNGVIPQFAPYMFTYEKNGKLIIKDGDFYGGWRFNGETATTDIYGGNFTVSYDGQSFHANSTHVLKVYGGVFDLNNGGKLNPTSHCAEGYKAIQNEDGSWSVITVAMIGETKYATLNDAVAAVKDGDTITLVANEEFTENNYYDNGGWKDGLGYAGDKSFTIDLDGKTISQNGALNDYLLWFKNVGSKANTITIKNGTLDAGTSAYCALCTASSHDNQLTINLENVNLINNNSNGSTIKVRAGSVVNVNAGSKITGKNSYLGIENWNATVNVYDGAEIYMNGTSSYNGCLIGVGGNGTVNVYGGYGKGVSGGLIAMTSGGTINVSGGEWIANTDGTYANSNKSVLIAQSDKQYNTGAGNAIVNVTGGTFKGGYNCYGNKVGDAQINIKGGNFNADPKSYVVAGYEATNNNGQWVVGEVVQE